jgi:cardiolipin synthase
MPFATWIPRPGHELVLLEGSQQYFNALITAIDAAHSEVLLETYIFDFTGAAADVAYALERAARRGLTVRVAVDGFGSGPAPQSWMQRFMDAGVDWRVFRPVGQWDLLFMPASWRRLHRKLCVVDGAVAFCGGINILDDFHDPNHGALESPRFDFAVQVRGPLVADAHLAMRRLWVRGGLKAHQRFAGVLTSLRENIASVAPAQRAARTSSRSRAALVLRDNLRNRGRIERAYRRAIGRAQEEIIIANAYFVPGAKMRRALIAAAKRGVRVCLLLQGRYEYFMQYYASRPVYGALLAAGVEIHEYSASFLHAKVATVDGRWATVGSSNLDPLSLLLAREANVVVEDRPFAGQLTERLRRAIAQEGRKMDADEYANRPLHERMRERLALGIMRVLLLIQGKTYL